MNFKTTVFLVSSIIFLGCSNPNNSKTEDFVEADTNQANINFDYQPIPIGYGYMENSKALANAVEEGNQAYIRSHGWKLWAGIMQPADGLDWPVWYTWQNTYGAFAKGDDDIVSEDHKINSMSLIQRNILHAGGMIMDTLENILPYYPIPAKVIAMYKDSGVFTDTSYSSIHVGERFLFNGDIMVPTESLSEAAFDWIRNDLLYTQAKLNVLHDSGRHELDAPQKHIVTKHMYWPVPAEGISALPVWHEDYYSPDFPGYAGYEKWTDIIGIDPSGNSIGDTAKISFLYGVYRNKKEKNVPIPTKIVNAKVHGLDEFYHHKITKNDWANFSPEDKAILNAASYWAHNKPLGIGDYIVTIAMHVNTKEIPTWALQSVWWSNSPEVGKYAADRPELPQAKGPWDHYLLVDSYGIPDPTTQKLPMAFNPYIELVIHPIATNCNNCHSRAGWPASFTPTVGKASYQNPDCPDLLEKLTPESACLADYMLTDFQWIIPDHAIK